MRSHEVAKPPPAPLCHNSLYLFIEIRKQVKELNSDSFHRNAFSFTSNQHNIFSKEIYSSLMNTDMQDSERLKRTLWKHFNRIISDNLEHTWTKQVVYIISCQNKYFLEAPFIPVRVSAHHPVYATLNPLHTTHYFTLSYSNSEFIVTLFSLPVLHSDIYH